MYHELYYISFYTFIQWGYIYITHTHIYQSEIYVHTRVYPDVFMDFYVPRHSIHNCQNLEATKLSFCGDWINKLWYIHVAESFSAHKKKRELLNHEKNTMES